MEEDQYSFAFQPIVDLRQRVTVAVEALVRGKDNEPAGTVLGPLSEQELWEFDIQARHRAIRLAQALDIRCRINLNYVPGSNTDSETELLNDLVTFASNCGIASSQLVLEVSERFAIRDVDRFTEQVDTARSAGVFFSIDDFGAGYSGLNFLAKFQPSDRKSTRLNSSHSQQSRMPSSA